MSGIGGLVALGHLFDALTEAGEDLVVGVDPATDGGEVVVARRRQVGEQSTITLLRSTATPTPTAVPATLAERLAAIAATDDGAEPIPGEVMPRPRVAAMWQRLLALYPASPIVEAGARHFLAERRVAA